MRKKFISLLLAGALVFGTLSSAGADEISDIENEAAVNQQQLDDLNASIDDIEDQKAALLGDIDEAEAQLVLTLAAVSTLTDQIDIKNQDLAQTSKNLEASEEDEAVQYEAMKKRIQYLYESGGDAGWAVILLEDTNITEFLNRAEYTQQMYDYDRRCLAEYAETVERVSSLKERQEAEKTDLERMLANQEEQQAHLEEQLTQMKAESKDYEKQIAEATKAADAYVDLINQQNSMIQELLAEQERQRQAEEAARIAEEEARAAEEAAAAQAAAEAEAAAQAAAEAEAEAQAAAEAAAAAAEEERAAAEAAAAEAAELARQQAEEAARAQQEAEEAERLRQEAEAAAQEDQPAVEEEQILEEDPSVEEQTETEPEETQEEEEALVVPEGNPIVDRAYAWVGRAEYVWGACSPGAFDCSGFVSYCVTGAYARIGTTYTFMGYPQVADPQPGDICTSETHCGIYIGNGMMIHASDYGIGVIISEVRPGMIYVRY